MKNSPSDQLTLLVFKDNQSPRTFSVSLKWLSRVGFLSVGWVTATLVLGFLSIRFYRQARINQSSDPEHLHALETQIATLRSQPVPTTTVTAAAASALAPSQTSVGSTSAPLPVPAVTVTVTATPAVNPLAVANSAPDHSPAILFQALPRQASIWPTTPPIKMRNLRSRWEKHQLLVSFNLEYTGPEGGNQAGRIVVLARGVSTLLGYPAGVFNPADQDALINIEKGEYFSVSRFRETTAQFGPVNSESSIDELEILIFGQNQTLIIDEKIKAGIKSTGETTPIVNPNNHPAPVTAPTDSEEDSKENTSE